MLTTETSRPQHSVPQQRPSDWGEPRRHLIAVRQRLEQHRHRRRFHELTPDDYWDYLRCVAEVEGDQQVLPLLDAMLMRYPTHAPALAVRGKLRLASSDRDGVNDLEAAMALDASLVGPGCELLCEFWQDQGDPAAVEHYRTRLTAFDAECELARLERQSVSEADELEPHERSADAVATLKATLSAQPSVHSVWLVRKRLAHFPHDPLYVLLIQFVGSGSVSADRLRQIGEQLPDDVCGLIIPSDRAGGLLARAQAMEGALILRRG